MLHQLIRRGIFFWLTLGLTVFTAPVAEAQGLTISAHLLAGFWSAKWISVPGLAGNDFSVSHFRKTIQLDLQPATFVVHVSADNRYRLFVNGVSVSTGPARSDLANWNYETVDLAPFLRKGSNTIAATVWNFGEYRPYSQISFQTAFLLQGNSPAEEILNTGAGWSAYHDKAYAPLELDRNKLNTYIVTAGGERLDGNKYPWGFASEGADTAGWVKATPLWYAAKSRSFGTDGNWMLVPRTIPLLEEKAQRFGSIRRASLPIADKEGFIAGTASLTIPANTKAKILFDQASLTNAYPQLTVSGGRNALIRMSYAESLVDAQKKKGNRDSIEGKELLGYSDEYVADGGQSRTFSPLFFRTFRYLELDITTGADPLEIKQFNNLFTGYPFKERGRFSSDRADLQKIWTTGWRTARLCAADTYFDCPYYEQLQYVGDTRIQSLISLYVAGDDRLMKKAIDDIGHSFFADGLTQSRYPSRDMQVIPTFSLWWVCMIHDFWMNRTDDAFIRSHLNTITNVLEWYRQRVTEKGMLGPLSWWQFVDWSWSWVDSIRVGGVPPGASQGGSSIVSLQYAYTLQRAAELMDRFGKPELAASYRNQAKAIAAKTFELCWDADKLLMADDYGKTSFSQHAAILAVLTDAVRPADQRALIERIIANRSITQCTYYFKFYLFEALKKVQLGDRFQDLLSPWYDMLNTGLSTFAENPEPTRSDCHAWSASPNYELLSLVCGIRPAKPGFAQVTIAPQPGSLHHIECTVPHPAGDIVFSMTIDGAKGQADIELPKGISGDFVWQQKSTALKPGKQTIRW